MSKTQGSFHKPRLANEQTDATKSPCYAVNNNHNYKLRVFIIIKCGLDPPLLKQVRIRSFWLETW